MSQNIATSLLIGHIDMTSDDKIEAIGRQLLAGERPKDELLAKVYDLSRAAMAKAQSEAEELEQLPDTESLSWSSTDELRGSNSPSALQQAQLDIFDSFPIAPGNEFPTFLTRIPIFRPSKRQSQQSLLDEDNAVQFETGFGSGRRHGPPLTTRDEDTLIALMRLRDRALQGPERLLPEELRDVHQSKNGTSEVHRVVCTIYQVNQELGLSDGGKNFQNTLASVKRLAACRIEMDRSISKSGTVGGTFDLLKVRWVVLDENGLLDVIFPPLISHWLGAYRTYIDWHTRKQLSELGKAVHRFLSSQRHHYCIDLCKLTNIVGYDGRHEHMRSKFRKACDELVECGWLFSYEITGNGRSVPLKLTVLRKESKAS